MALGVEPPEPDVMRRPPRRPDEGVFARRLGIKIIGRGFLIGLGTLGAFVVGLLTATGTPGMLPPQDPLVLERARTMALATLVSAQLIHVFDCRSERRTIFETGLFGNPWLVGAVLSSLTALLLAIYWTPMSTVFGTAQLNMREWVVILGFASVGEMAVALRRFLMFGRPVRMRRSAEEET
jgi:Ca2+-transporting ATPase